MEVSPLKAAWKSSAELVELVNCLLLLMRRMDLGCVASWGLP